ncbi:MAG: sarcosine oxidase subunit gamma [Rhodoferax sp.]|nr:sarcosine oxidase subunit gamma [Rhodoferax sp.]
MSDAVLQSPLAPLFGAGDKSLVVDGQAVGLGEAPLMDMLNLRGDPADARFCSAVHTVTGLALPLVANTASVGADRQLLWLGPDECLLQCPIGQGAALEAALREAMPGQHMAIVNVGHGNTVLRVQGPGAADLLSRGCPLDFHASVFAAGQVAQSHISRANATILCKQAGSHYEVTVRRSFADYLFRWLCAAAGA